LEAWFCRVDTGTLRSDALRGESTGPAPPAHAVLADDMAYNDRRRCPEEPLGVLIGYPPADLAATAARYNRTPESQRPLLMHAFLPGLPFVDFVSAGLPRPMPILPLLIRKGLYTHRPGGPPPETSELLRMLAAALDKKITATSAYEPS
jgi:hypothetical protein